jgi:hypothetical protein
MLREEATNTNFIVFGLTPSGLEPTIYRIRGEHVEFCSWARDLEKTPCLLETLTPKCFDDMKYLKAM